MTMTMSPMLAVAEVFGPTVQGEGPTSGRRAAFVRLGGCNLQCVWCDTPYTWDGSRYDLKAEITAWPLPTVVDLVLATAAGRLIITGGEPLLQGVNVGLLAGALREYDWAVEVETNGTLFPDSRVLRQVSQWNLSPKLAHSGNPTTSRLNRAALSRWSEQPNAVWKFVVREESDLVEVDALVAEFGVPHDRVWLMPEGTGQRHIVAGLQRFAVPAIARGYNLSNRLHSLVWGAARGH